ncbi:MAG: peptidylprolyl isomerase [Candidatus Competibacteraceae bacterium]
MVSNLLKQPLIQFLLLGMVIFVMDRVVIGSEDDPRRILIDDAKYAEIAGIYKDNQGRAPSEQEMANLTVKWAQNEVLYREARLMGLDKGDEMIRQRLILKLRNVLFNRVVVESPKEQELLAWFEKNRAAYDRPESYDFEQFKVGGPEAGDLAADLADELAAKPASTEWQNQLRRYQKRPAHNLKLLFGKTHAATLINSADGKWVPVQSPGGWHLARITARHPGRQADFTEIRSQVIEDWKSQAMQAELGEALRGIANRYDIRVELSTPPEGWDSQQIEAARLAMGSGE